MKKLLSITLLALIAFTIPFAFIGCKSTSSKVIGTWTLKENRQLDDKGALISTTPTRKDYICTICFKKNKTVIYSDKIVGDQSFSNTIEGTWKQTSNNTIEASMTRYDDDNNSWINKWIFKIENNELVYYKQKNDLFIFIK